MLVNVGQSAIINAELDLKSAAQESMIIAESRSVITRGGLDRLPSDHTMQGAMALPGSTASSSSSYSRPPHITRTRTALSVTLRYR